MTNDKPVTPPKPASELAVLRAQVAELTAIKANDLHGLACGLQTWSGGHPTMTALAALIAEKVNWRCEALQHRADRTQLRAELEDIFRTLQDLHRQLTETADLLKQGSVLGEHAAALNDLATVQIERLGLS